jgi:hypothetical protein
MPSVTQVHFTAYVPLRELRAIYQDDESPATYVHKGENGLNTALEPHHSNDVNNKRAAQHCG